jgi:hypothetical protein
MALEDAIRGAETRPRPPRPTSRVYRRARYMHDLCMATKTISLRIEAYAKLTRARRYPDESFSEVVLRATWPDETLTGAGLLERYREHGPVLGDEGIARIEQLNDDDPPPEDKWKGN